MTNVEILPAVYVRLENRPGTLERAARVFKDHKINVEAISLETNGNEGFTRILTHKSKEAVEQLRKLNIEAYESQFAVTNLQNRTGELARATADLAAAGLNIESILTTPDGRLAFRTNDVERAAQILRKL